MACSGLVDLLSESQEGMVMRYNKQIGTDTIINYSRVMASVANLDLRYHNNGSAYTANICRGGKRGVYQ